MKAYKCDFLKTKQRKNELTKNKTKATTTIKQTNPKNVKVEIVIYDENKTWHFIC